MLFVPQTEIRSADCKSSCSVHCPEDAECWICHEDGLQQPLIHPCLCKGSLEHVHSSCIQRWVMQQYKSAIVEPRCSICNYLYQYSIVQLPPRFQLRFDTQEHFTLFFLIGCQILLALCDFNSIVSLDTVLDQLEHKISYYSIANFLHLLTVGIVLCAGLYTLCTMWFHSSQEIVIHNMETPRTELKQDTDKSLNGLEDWIWT